MTNSIMLRELISFARTSNMMNLPVTTVLGEYIDHLLDDYYHTPLYLITSEDESLLRSLYDNPIISEEQMWIIEELLTEIGLAKAEIAAMNKDCEGPDDYDDCDYLYDCYDIEEDNHRNAISEVMSYGHTKEEAINILNGRNPDGSDFIDFPF